MGRAGGVTGGKDGNMHFGDRELGCVGMVSMLPDMALVASGMALAFKLRGEPRVALTFFGEGSTANGQWHEAMNFAGVQRLPVVFVLENNRFAYSTPNELEFAVDPVERAEGYGFPGVEVDGNDVEAVFAAVAEAVERAREGGGPTLIECQTMRMHGHGAHDDMSYVPAELLAEWARARPDRALRERLVERPRLRAGRGSSSSRARSRPRSTECAERALASPMPDPARRREGVFAERWRAARRRAAPWSRWTARAEEAATSAWQPLTSGPPDASEPRARPRPTRVEMTYLEAISDALRTEMRRDESVFCLGEDIGAFGGAFKVTDGFAEEFGADRVLDTPLAENAIIGAAVGAAIEGMQPGLRDAVRRLHRLRLRPARQRRGEDALPAGHRRADGRPPALAAAASPAARSTRRTRRPGSCRRRG